MKINKEQLRMLADLPDEALWQSIRDMAKSRGYDLPQKKPSAAEMEKIRGAMRGTEKINLSETISLLKKLKKG